MAINPNTSLKNNNHIYIATSGGGKSQALLQNPCIPKSGARVVLWDIDHDHKAHHIDNMRAYKRALIAAIKSGQPYRLAYSGDDTPAAFETWCALVWAILDGNKTLHVIIEELADVCESIGKAGPHFGRLLRKGRKHGAQLHITSQRSAEIPKTAFTQCPVKYIGQQDGDNDIKRMSALINVRPEQIKALEPLQYYRKVTGPEPAQLVKLRYKKPAQY